MDGQKDRLIVAAEENGWVVQVSSPVGRVQQVRFVRPGDLVTADFRHPDGLALYGQRWEGDSLRLTYTYSVFATLRSWLGSTPS